MLRKCGVMNIYAMLSKVMHYCTRVQIYSCCISDHSHTYEESKVRYMYSPTEACTSRGRQWAKTVVSIIKFGCCYLGRFEHTVADYGGEEGKKKKTGGAETSPQVLQTSTPNLLMGRRGKKTGDRHRGDLLDCPTF